MADALWLKPRIKGAGYDVSSIQIPLPNADTRDPREVAKKAETFSSSPNALTAASQKIDLKAGGSPWRSFKQDEWQNEVMQMYRSVGEFHYGAGLFSNAMSRMNLEIERREDNGDWMRLSNIEDDNRNAKDKVASDVLDELFSDMSPEGFLKKWGLNYFTVGEAMLVGLPREGTKSLPGKLMDIRWVMLSKADVQKVNGKLHILGEEYDENDVSLTRVWNPDPERHMMPDSPARSVLPILREIVGLTMFVGALIDSRLAGAGILLIPASATVLGGSPPEDDQEEDPTIAALIEAMVTPIKDRDSAASVVPLVLTAPDEAIDAIRHISFSSDLDMAAKELRDEAIRRLALGLDMPPEQLLGVAESSSHWGSWLIKEDVVALHLLPSVRPLTQSLTKDYLRLVLAELGWSDEDQNKYRIAACADELVSRPERFNEAIELYRAGAISLPSLLKHSGMELSDAPEEALTMDKATQMAMLAVSTNPSLFGDPGLMSIISQLRAGFQGFDLSNAPEEALPPLLREATQPGDGAEDEDHVSDGTAPPPESDSDRKPGDRGPAKNRERDN